MAQAVAIGLATEFGVSAGGTLLERFQKNLFGGGRATRSTDVFIANKSNEALVLVSCPQPKDNYDGSGIWTSTLLPPHRIEAGTIEGYGCESNGFATGVTNAKVTYRGESSGTVYTFSTSNPYIGGNHSEATPSSVLIIPGGGDNNTVKFVLE